MIKNFIKTVAKAIKVKRKGPSKSTYFETEITIPEKAINVFLEVAIERESEVQKPHIVVHDNYFDFKFFLIEGKNKATFYHIPLHVSRLEVIGGRHVAILELAGKISIVPGNSRHLVVEKFKQGVCNSKYGRHKLLTKLSENVTHLKYKPSFMMFGDEIRPVALQFDLTQVLKENQTGAFLLNYGITNVLGVSDFKEKEGKFILTLSVGKHGRDSRTESSGGKRFFNVT